MKTRLAIWTTTAIALLFVLNNFAFAGDTATPLQLTLQEGSKLWLEGDSTIHAFESIANEMDLQSTVTLGNGGAISNITVIGANADLARVSDLVLTIPIKKMTSPTAGLASRLHKTLKHKEHPNIVFRMHKYTVAANPAEAGSYTVAATGDVSLGGVTNTLNISMSGQHGANGATVKGEQLLLMSSFGITPPTMMFGKIKVDDEIVIKWELAVGLTEKERRPEATE